MINKKQKQAIIGLASGILETTPMSPHLQRKAKRYLENLPRRLSVRLLILHANYTLLHDRALFWMIFALRSLPPGKGDVTGEELFRHVRKGLMEDSKEIRGCSGMKLQTLNVVQTRDLKHALELYNKLRDKESRFEQWPKSTQAIHSPARKAERSKPG
jgi:hypothetical protein